MARTLEVNITAQLHGMRVGEVLRNKLLVSGSLIKELKKYPDGILINGKHIRTVDCVSEGDVLSITMHDAPSENVIPEKTELDIMYEDEDILVINKPSGMPTHPSQGHFTGTLANGVMYHYAQKGEEHMFRAANRLDKDTSGVMCIAKNSHAHDRLSREIQTHELRRKYLAIAVGELSGEGTVDAPIARLDGLKRYVSDEGQSAVTHYRAVKILNGYTLTELCLETGRTHQIRVHMAYIGHPLLGDWLYGEENDIFPRQALHSSYLRLIHPVTGEEMEFVPPLPEDMESFLQIQTKNIKS